MSRALSRTVDAADDGMRLDMYCSEHGLYASRSAAAKAIEAGKVTVNGQAVTKKHTVHTGDTVVYVLEDEKATDILEAQPIDLDIRFEDDDLIVLSKQIGLVCHPTDDYRDNTLVNALLWHCGAENLCNVQGEDDRLGIVHRLDRDTSGLMLAAKSDAAGSALMEAIRVRAVDRHYLALVHGIISTDSGMIDAPIARAADDRTRMAVRDVPSAREAITTFKVLERFATGDKDNGYTLIECKLFTGRTHQIRVHMQYTKHPIVGDAVYTAHAPKAEAASLGLPRQFLHSYRIGFDHPMTGEHLEFADNVPSDLTDALELIAPRSLGKTDAGREVERLLAHSPVPTVEGYVYEGL